MDKKKLHHQYTTVRDIKAWPFLVAAVVCLAVGVYGLRRNNLEMVKLRQNVTTVDEQNGDVEAALRELRTYVYGHMNTNLSSGNVAIKPPIQLKARYDRLAGKEAQRVKAENKEIEAKGQAECTAQYPAAGFNSPRVACIAEYMRVNGVTESSVPSDLYKFDFVSPRWSPDLAGFALLGSAVFFILFIVRWMVLFWYKRIV